MNGRKLVDDTDRKKYMRANLSGIQTRAPRKWPLSYAASLDPLWRSRRIELLQRDCPQIRTKDCRAYVPNRGIARGRLPMARTNRPAAGDADVVDAVLRADAR